MFNFRDAGIKSQNPYAWLLLTVMKKILFIILADSDSDIFPQTQSYITNINIFTERIIHTNDSNII